MKDSQESITFDRLLNKMIMMYNSPNKPDKPIFSQLTLYLFKAMNCNVKIVQIVDNEKRI